MLEFALLVLPASYVYVAMATSSLSSVLTMVCVCVCVSCFRFQPFVCGWCVKELNLIEVVEKVLRLNQRSLGAPNRSAYAINRQWLNWRAHDHPIIVDSPKHTPYCLLFAYYGRFKHLNNGGLKLDHSDSGTCR